MELRIWLLLALVMLFSFGVIVVAMAVVVTTKRLNRLESRVRDVDVWIDCVDAGLPPAIARVVQADYVARMRKRDEILRASK